MPLYTYEARNLKGIRIKSEIDAPTDLVAKSSLRDQGLFVLKLSSDAATEKSLPWYRRDLVIIGGNSALKSDVLDAITMLAEFLQSGFSESDSLNIVASSLENPALKTQFQKANFQLQEGDLFASALTRQVPSLPSSLQTVLSLNLPKHIVGSLLSKVSSAEKKRISRAQKVNAALLYPAIILLAAICLIFVIIFYLMPSLVPLFNSMGSSVPPVLNFFNNLRLFIISNGVVVLLIFAATTAAVVFFRRALFKLLFDVVSIMPIVRKFYENRNAGEFALLLGSLVGSGVSLQDAAYVLSRELSVNDSGTLTQLSRDLETGLNVGVALKKLVGFPSAFVSLLVMAANSKNFPSILEAQAEHYFERSERVSEKLIALVTPVLLITVGAIVALVIFTISSAILEINDAAFLQN